MSATPLQNGQSGRLSNGQFAPGHTHSKGKGRPRDDKLRELREAVRGCLSADELVALMRKTYDEAMSPETGTKDRVTCARFVMDYSVGKPDALDAGLSVTAKDGALEIRYITPAEADDDE